MSLLREIKHVDRRAASVLEKAKLHTDSAILSLTREDLRDLFPKTEDFPLRRTLFDTIHKQPIAEQLLKRRKGFIPHDSLRAALTNNGVLVDYLHLMKDMRTQMDGQRSFIDAHIRFLEEMSADQVDSPRTDGCSQEHGGSGTSDAGGQQTVLTDGYPQGSGASDGDDQRNQPAGSTGDSHEYDAPYSGTSASATGGPVGGQCGGFPQKAPGSGASDVDGQRNQPAGSTGDSREYDGSGASDGDQRNLPAGSTSDSHEYDGPVGHPRFQRGDYSQGAQAALHSGTSASATGGPVGGQSGGSPRKAPGSGASYVGDQRNLPAGSTGDSHESDGSGASDVDGQRNQPAGSTGDSREYDGSGASDGDQRNLPAGSTGDSHESDGPVGHPGVQSGDYSQGAQAALHSGTSASATVGPVGGQSGGSSRKALGSGASYVGDQRNLPAGSTGDSHESDDPVGHTRVQSGDYSQGAQALLYKMVVGGKTFDIHKKLMEKVKKQVKNRIRLCDDKQDYKLTFVICPISSRIGADVEAAMADIRDDKPIILVLMHHTREVKPVTSMKTWPEGANVVLRVNVFFHETTGLLKCEQNDAAVVEIKNILLQCYIQGSNDTSGDAQGDGGILDRILSRGKKK